MLFPSLENEKQTSAEMPQNCTNQISQLQRQKLNLNTLGEKRNFLEGSCHHKKVIGAARLKGNNEIRNLILIRVPLYLLSHTISAHFTPHETIHIETSQFHHCRVTESFLWWQFQKSQGKTLSGLTLANESWPFSRLPPI